MVYELTPEQDKWLEEVFKPSMHLTIRGQVLTNYYEAEKLLTGANRHLTRGCSCELNGLKNKVGGIKPFLIEEISQHATNTTVKSDIV